MINVLDLPAVRAQIDAAANATASQSDANSSDEPLQQENQPTPRSRPTLALDNGQYYVVEGDK